MIFLTFVPSDQMHMKTNVAFFFYFFIFFFPVHLSIILEVNQLNAQNLVL